MQMLESWDLKKNLLAYLKCVWGNLQEKSCTFLLPAGPPSFLFLFPVLWAENTSAPLKQVLGLGSWERIVSGAAVPASAGENGCGTDPCKLW